MCRVYAAPYECGDCRRLSQVICILVVTYLGAGLWSQVQTLLPALFSAGLVCFQLLRVLCVLSRAAECAFLLCIACLYTRCVSVGAR